jgi:hypothetical protein
VMKTDPFPPWDSTSFERSMMRINSPTNAPSSNRIVEFLYQTVNRFISAESRATRWWPTRTVCRNERFLPLHLVYNVLSR